MKLIRLSLLTALFLMASVKIFSQVTSIPAAAKENFARQYPNAQNINWDNDIINVHVRFELDGFKMNAEYNNKGIWKDTFKDWSYEELPKEVQDGFNKSKYADQTVTEVKIVYYPANIEQYRLKVEKNDLQKKYLFFNTKGRLIRESITI